MATFNVNDLIARTRRKADMANTSFVSDAELLEYLNEAYNKYYNTLVTLYENYFLKTATIQLVNAQADYSLPTDTFKISIFQLNKGANDKFILRPYNLIDMNRAMNSVIATVTHYVLLSDTVKFVPTPSTTETVTMYYVPQPTALTAGGTVSVLAGADEYLILESVVSCLLKEESDPSGYETKAQQKLSDIVTVLSGRNSDIPLRVSDTESMNYNNFPYVYGI